MSGVKEATVEDAAQTVLAQAEVLSEGWSG